MDNNHGHLWNTILDGPQKYSAIANVALNKEYTSQWVARVALTGLTIAECFRDEDGQDVVLFVDNVSDSLRVPSS